MFRQTAPVYDLIYEAQGKDYAAESAELRALISARAARTRSLLDVACGTGGHLVHLRDRYDVTGLDLDPSMLEVARARLPDVTLLEADMRTFELGRRFEAVVCLFSSIGYLRSTAELRDALATMARHLEPGGVLVVDGWVRPDRWRPGGSTHIETAETDTAKVVRCGRSRRDGDTTFLEMHHLVATADGIEHLVDHHELTLFTDEQYIAAFALAGLEVEVVPSPMPDRDRYVGIRPPERPVPDSRPRAGSPAIGRSDGVDFL